MSIRKLFAVLVAVAVLLAPGFTSAAMAGAPAHDMKTLMRAGHCEAPPSSTDHQEKTAGKSCCVSMCTAVAIAPAEALVAHEIAPASPISTIRSLHLAYLGEIATPPPRGS